MTAYVILLKKLMTLPKWYANPKAVLHRLQVNQTKHIIMALNVSYKNKIGYFTATQTNAGGTHKYRIDICQANCLCAMVHFHKNENGEKMVHLVSFFADIQHAKQCFKDGFFLDKWNNFVFHVKECDTEMWKFIRLLADNGKKITIK